MGVGPSHLDVPSWTYLLLSLAGGTEVSILQVAKWFHVWQSPKKHLGDVEGHPRSEDELSGDTEHEGEEAVMFPSMVVDRLWPR